MNTATTLAWDNQQLEQLQAAQQVQLPEALKLWQQQQLRYFMAQSLPTRKTEAWKYTNIRELIKQPYELMAPELIVSAEVAKALDTMSRIEKSYLLVFINGQFSKEHSELSQLPANIECIDLKTFAKTQPARLNYLQQSIQDVPVSLFAQLNHGLSQEGIVLQVAKNAVIKEPLHIVNIVTEQKAPVSMQNQLWFDLGVNCQLTVVNEFLANDNSLYFNNHFTGVVAQDGAKLKLYKIQCDSINAFHIANVALALAKNSCVNWQHIARGSRLARTDFNAMFNGEGAQCHMSGLFQVSGEQHFDIHSQMLHMQANTSSSQSYKGVLNDHARGVFNGRVYVAKEAQQINAYQSNHNLLLSDNAEIDTKPELEIYADDVKCAHGATVGQLDQDALFFLRSRGIAEQQARHMLIRGFVQEVLDAILDTNIRDYIECQMRRFDCE